MLTTIEGVYRNGEIALKEQPVEIEEAPVLVTFLASPQNGDLTDEQKAARKRISERMRKGMDLGGPPYPKREELYDRDDTSRRSARERVLQRMKKGYSLGGAPYPTRDELHDRKIDR